MRATHYILDEQGEPVALPWSDEGNCVWAEWFEDVNNRIVKQTPVPVCGHEMTVSTVFLGLDQDIFAPVPVLWETMVLGNQGVINQLVDLADMETRSRICQFFGGKDIQRRYTSRHDAIKGHAQMVQFVEVCSTKVHEPLEEETEL